MSNPITKKKWMKYLEKAWDAAQEEAWQQEAIGWYIEGYAAFLGPIRPDIRYEEWRPMYKRPPQRTWVGLSWEEIDECFKITPDQYLPAQIYRRIEAKLRSKNG